MNYNEWLDIDVLEDYLDGKLDAKTMHRVEKLSLEDPFVAEALAGLSQLPKRNQSLSLLQKQLQERVALKPVEQKRWRITSQRLSIAATAAVLFVTVSVLFWMRENNRQQTITNQPKNVKVNVAPTVIKPVPETNKVQPEVNTVIDQAIIAAKTNSYAQNQNKLNRKKYSPIKGNGISPSIATADAIPVAVTVAENITLARTSEQKAKEADAVATVSVASALQGKVAGLSITPKAKVVGQTLKGTVYAKDDRLPIPGVAIKDATGQIAATTNSKGEFVIAVDSLSKSSKLTFAYLGFVQKEANVKANEPIKIELEPDHNSLNEVVITSVAKRNKKVTTATNKVTIAPIEGWEKLEQYFLDNNKLLKNRETTGKSVQLSFNVKRNKRPTNIKVVSGLTKEQNDEAVRLLHDGPAWEFNPNAPKLVTVTIKF